MRRVGSKFWVWNSDDWIWSYIIKSKVYKERSCICSVQVIFQRKKRLIILKLVNVIKADDCIQKCWLTLTTSILLDFIMINFSGIIMFVIFIGSKFQPQFSCCIFRNVLRFCKNCWKVLKTFPNKYEIHLEFSTLRIIIISNLNIQNIQYAYLEFTINNFYLIRNIVSVSYTHLTLPTIYSV